MHVGLSALHWIRIEGPQKTDWYRPMPDGSWQHVAWCERVVYLGAGKHIEGDMWAMYLDSYRKSIEYLEWKDPLEVFSRN